MKKQKIFIFCTIFFALLFSSCDVVKKIIGFPDVDLGNLVNAKQSSNGVEYDRNDFFQVCAFGTERQIRSTLKQNPGIVNQTDGHGFTPIFYAVLGSNPQTFSDKFMSFVENFVDIYENQDAFYEFLDDLPKASGEISSIKALLKYGAMPSAKDNNDISLFQYAVIFGDNVDVLQELVKYGVGVKEPLIINGLSDPDSYITYTLLDLAVIFDRSPEVVKYLAKESGDIDGENSINPLTSALLWASFFTRNPEVIDALFDCGAKLDENEYLTLAFAAVYNRNDDVVRKIISHSNIDRDTTLDFLWFIENTDRIRLIIDELNYQVDFDTLEYAIQNVKDKEILECLFSYFPNVNYHDEHDYTLLGYSVEKGNVEAVKVLIKNGADVNSTFDSGNKTALFQAVNMSKPNTEIVKELVSSGANVNATTKEGITPLIYAVNKNTTTDVAMILINAGAKKDVKYNGNYVYEYCNSNIKKTSVYTELRNAVKSNSWW